MCSSYKAPEQTRTLNTAVLEGKSWENDQQSQKRKWLSVLVFNAAGGRWCWCLEKSTNCVRFLSKSGKKNLHAALHIVSAREKNSTVPVRNHYVWCFSPQVWTNHSQVNMLPSCVQLLENMASVLIPLFSISSPLPLLWPPRRTSGAAREDASRMFQQAVCCCHPCRPAN